MRKKFKQLGKESLIYGVSGMLQKFIAILLVPLYWNVFAPEELGQQALVIVVVTLLSALAVLGMDHASHTWFWQTEEETDRRSTIATWFWCQTTVSLVLAALLVLLANPVSWLLTGENSSAHLLRLAAATLPLNVTSAVLTNYFRLRRRPGATLFFTVASTLLLVGFNLYFILVLHWGLPGFFLSQIASGACCTIAGVWLLRHTIRPRMAKLPRLREMLRFAVPLMPAALAMWVMGLSDRVFIEKFLDTGEVGLYQAGASLATAVGLITGAFVTAWGPFALSQQREPEAPALYARGLLLYLALGGAMVAGVALFTPEALRLLARPDYLGAAPVVGILSLGVLANGLASIASTGLNLAKKSAPVTAGVFIASVVSVALNIALIPLLGKTGSAWASAISWMVCSGYVFLRAQRIHPLPYDLRRALIIGALLVAMVSVAPLLDRGTAANAVLLKFLTCCAFLPVLFTVALPGWPGMLRRAWGRPHR
jgi:O-antigen/teichoic acid export membrane protein